jgi:hypothetical protein
MPFNFKLVKYFPPAGRRIMRVGSDEMNSSTPPPPVIDGFKELLDVEVGKGGSERTLH